MTSSTYLLRQQGRSNPTTYKVKSGALNKHCLCIVHVQFPSISPPPTHTHTHSRNWILYLRFLSRQNNATRPIRHDFCENLCSGPYFTYGHKRNIAIFFVSFGHNLARATKNHRVMGLWSNSMHIILSSICDFRRKNGRTFYRYQSNYIFALPTPPPHLIPSLARAGRQL